MNRSRLHAQGISKKFIQAEQEITVIQNIDSTFLSGNSYAITGISGSGKSTFMHILAGLDAPSSGTVFFNELCLYACSPSTLAEFLNKSIGLVFQSPYLIRELSIVENIMIPGLISGLHKRDCEKKAEQLLEKIGLIHKKNSKPGELSGGQQQRVAIARALFNDPAFLIADEPTGNLDVATGKEIIELLLSCCVQAGMGIIVSSHDDYVVQSMNEIYELKEGRLHVVTKNNS